MMKTKKKLFSNTQSNFKLLFRFGVLALPVLTIVFLWQTSAGKQELVTAAVFDNDSSTAEQQTAKVPMTSEQLQTAYGKLPLSFERNQGQTEDSVNFLARGAGYSLFLKPTEAVFVMARQQKQQTKNDIKQLAEKGASNLTKLQATALQMNLIGANSESVSEGAEEQTSKVNYFVGNDESKWKTGVRTFARVNYKDVYAGIDLTYYGNKQQLEYDFVVSPNADYRQIRLDFKGAKKVEIENTSGDLLLHTQLGVMREHQPRVYQEINGKKQEIASRYIKRGKEIGFEVGDYDKAQTLVIDPTLVYSTYLGGSSDDHGNGIAVDSSGNTYITGATSSLNFPTVNPLQPNFNAGNDLFVTKLSADGQSLVYSTYLGGNSLDSGSSIAVDSLGNAYVTGSTLSTDFPTHNPFQPNSASPGTGTDGFVAKISADGQQLIYSTYLGGTRADYGWGIAADSSGNAYLTGFTNSADFPTLNQIQTNIFGTTGDVFVTELSTGGQLIYSTYLGGNGSDQGFGIALDSSGNTYITGQTFSTNFPTTNNAPQQTSGGGSDAFIAKLSAINVTGLQLLYSTYLGGNNSDISRGIAVDSSGNAYIAGDTDSTNFPTRNARQPNYGGNTDAFLTKLSANGQQFVYSTYLGGSNRDSSAGIAVNSSGIAYIAGTTTSTNFPVRNALQPAYGGGFDGDAFITKMSANGLQFYYSTYLGGNNTDGALSLAIDSSGSAYITGQTGSPNFPTMNPRQPNSGGGFDGFISKISDAAPLPATQFDFDGDGRTDLGVFRPSNGTWYLNRSTSSFYGVQFGAASDKLAPADYDGDGKAEIAVWREGSFAYFYILQSSTNTVRNEQFGQTGDSPIVVGDWDGDGKADPAVYRAATTAGGQSLFYYRPSTQPAVNFITVYWGTAGDVPQRGDFDGDGKMDAAVYRPSANQWIIRNSSNNQVSYQTFGLATDNFVPADYDGDGKTDLAVFRPSTGSWYILQSSSGQIRYQAFGLSTDQLVPGDYDGDGKTDIAVFRSSNGIWSVLKSTTSSIEYSQFGQTGDTAVPSAYIQ